jgi:hypothetical protein
MLERRPAGGAEHVGRRHRGGAVGTGVRHETRPAAQACRRLCRRRRPITNRAFPCRHVGEPLRQSGGSSVFSYSSRPSPFERPRCVPVPSNGQVDGGSTRLSWGLAARGEGRRASGDGKRGLSPFPDDSLSHHGLLEPPLVTQLCP